MSDKADVSVQPASLEDYANFLEGPQVQDGGRYDGDPRGVTSEDPTFFQQHYPAPPEETPFVQQPQPQNWQALYGREANEKGQWRRTAEDALQQLADIKAELASYRTDRPQAAYSNVAPQIQPETPPIPERFLPDRDPQDAILVEDMERILRERVAPEIWNLREAQRKAYMMQVQAQLVSRGINPAIEAGLVRRHPWLGSITDPFARIEAMQELMQQPAAPAQPPQQLAPRPAPGNAAVRRLTMVESMTPQASEADMDAEQIMRREMADAMSKPFGSDERRQAMQRVFAKYGITHANDLGSGVLPR